MTLKKLTPTRKDRKLTQVLRGSPYCQNPQHIILVGRVVFPMSTLDKEITLFPMLVGRREVGNDRSGSGPLRNIQEAFRGLLHVEEIQQQSNTRDPEALIPKKKNQKANQDALKIRRDLDRAYIEMLHNAFDEGVQKKAKTILKGRLKEADHLGNGNNVRHEEIRTPDLDAGGRSITSSKGFSV